MVVALFTVTFAEKHLDGTQDDVDQAIFLHFLQLEDMTKKIFQFENDDLLSVIIK